MMDRANTGTDFVGWFGKLPSVGDYASRGIPAHMRDTLHAWFAEGMNELAASQPDDWREAYLVSPVWHFCITPGVWESSALIGCIAPSIDKVGRCSPLLALNAIGGRRIDTVLPPQSQWLYRVESLLRRVISECLPVDEVAQELEMLIVNELECARDESSATAILADLDILASTQPRKNWFSWPELPEIFEERPGRSFWWAEPSPTLPPRQLVHAGRPDGELLAILMGGWLK